MDAAIVRCADLFEVPQPVLGQAAAEREGRRRKMKKSLAIMFAALFAVPAAGETVGKWVVSPFYAPIFEFNTTFLDKAIGGYVEGIEDTPLMGISFDYLRSERATISIGFSYARNDARNAGSEVRITPPPDDMPWSGTIHETRTWDGSMDMDFKALTISTIQKFNPQSRAVVFWGAGIGVCYISGKLEGWEERYTIVVGREEREDTTYHYPEEWTERTDYNDDYSKFFPVFDARVGVDFHITDRFILSVEERFVNGLGTFVSGKFIF